MINWLKHNWLDTVLGFGLMGTLAMLSFVLPTRVVVFALGVASIGIVLSNNEIIGVKE